jgi:hypothetical protein
VVDAAAAYFLGGLSKVGKAADFASQVIKAAARKVVVKLREPPPAEGARGYERERDFAKAQRIQQNLSERGLNRIPRDIPKRNPNETRKWKRDLLERGRRFYSDPRDFERFEGRAQRADVDHRHELQLGGQDIHGNFTLTESGVNRSIGAQIRGQTRGHPPGTRVDFE